MPWSIANTDYEPDPWPQWRNANDRVEYEHAFKPSPYTQQVIAQFDVLSDPATPNAFIRDNLTHAPMMDWGSPRPQPTIEGVLSGDALQTPQANFSDFSGSNGGYSGSVRNNISIGS